MQATKFNDYFLGTLKFNSSQDAYNYLNSLAASEGFKLTRKDTLSSPCIRCFCFKANISKGQKTLKTGCQFHFSIIKKNEEDGNIQFVIGSKKNLLHNHELVVPRSKSVNEDTQEIVKKMKKIGIKNYQICEFIQIEKGILITPADIESISANMEPEKTSFQTAELSHYMNSISGNFEIYSIQKENKNNIIAIFTQTEEEHENLLKYGDVIFFDGTKINNELRWDLFPVTLIDNNKEIVSGGVFFLGLQTSDVFRWTLEIMFRYSNEIITTLFTDEDSAIMTAIPDFINSIKYINHYICTLHKFKNIIKKINSMNISKTIKDQLIQYANIMCYNSNRFEAEDALNKMYLLCPQMSLYLQNLQNNFHKFAYCAKGNCLTLGYNTTAPSESCNKMIKNYLPAKILTLKELREHIISAFIYKRKSKPIDQYHLTVEQLELLKIINLPISMKIFVLIEKEYKESKELRIEDIKDNEVICIDKKNSYTVTNFTCTCGYKECNGIPCRHLIHVHLKLSNNRYFPSFLIHERWYTKEITEKPKANIIIIDNNNLSNINSSSDSDFVLDSSETYDTISEISDYSSIGEDGSSSNEYSNRAMYQKLFYKGKEIARMGATSDKYEYVEKKLNKIISKLTITEPMIDEPIIEQPIVDQVMIDEQTVDQPNRASRGRPRKKGYANGPEKILPRCKICGKKHLTENCIHYGLLKKNIEKYRGKTEGKKQCSICHYFGHNSSNCIPLIETRSMIIN